MALDVSPATSRRAVIGAALGALAALAAQAIGRPAPTRAADGNAVVVGGEYNATSQTKFTNTSNGGTLLAGVSTVGGVGIYGESTSGYGVHAKSTSGYATWTESDTSAGIYATSDTNDGVRAFSGSGNAISGSTFGADHPAIVGRNLASGTGLLGVSNSDQYVPPAPPKTGVYGYAIQDPGSRGVWGEATSGQGVRGQATSGLGVRGFATSGAAGSFEATTGWAIQSSGRVSFGKVSGIATIAAGTATKVVSPGVDLASATFVLLTPRANLGTRALWYSLDTVANTFTIHVSSNLGGAAAVGWLVIG
jgi:hypothetical protein